jgi:peptide/nickel transport system substrate-binding protein
MTLQHSSSPVQRLLRDMSRRRLTRREAFKHASRLGLSASAFAGLLSATPMRSAAALPARQDGTPVRGGSVRVGVAGSAGGFDPALYTTMEEIYVLEHIFSSLVRTTPDMELEPDLALSWASNETGDRWTFTLRDDVTFHDGEAFSAEDVLATIDYNLNPATASLFRTNIAMVDRVEATSPTEVVFHLAYPFAEFPEQLAHYQARIMPAGKMGQMATDPIGTGPYRLEDYIPGERTVLSRYDGYFDLEGQGFLNEIQYLAIPEEATKVAALTSGGIELANEFQPTSLPPLESAPTVTTTEIISGSHQPIVMDVTQAPFDDARVRAALKLCVHRDGLVAVALQGHGVPAADQVVPPTDPMYGDVPIPAQDLERARQLLEEAGYPDGLGLTLHVTPGRPGIMETGLAFKDMALGAGVRVELVSHPVDVYWAEIWKHEAFLVSNWIGRPTADMMLSTVYMCGASNTESNWCNEEFDDRIMAARAALDPEERRGILADAQRILAADGPVIVPYFRSYITGYANRLQGYRAHPLRYLDLRRAWLSE